jgi:hypothetical protein
MPTKDTKLKGALEKIGRNLILFQHIEHALKGLITLGSISYSSTNGQRPFPHQCQSLGLVAVAFVQRHLSTTSPLFPETDSADDEAIIQSSFQIEGAAAEDLANRIKRSVPDRNRLAHLLITDFDLSDAAGVKAAAAWLDETFAEHTQLLEILKHHHCSVREGFQIIASFLSSEQGLAEIRLPHIQGTPIIQRMLLAAEAPGNAGSWIPISDAAKGESRVEVHQTLARFRLKSLSELMLASSLFELKAEESASGGTRMIYRLRSPGTVEHMNAMPEIAVSSNVQCP